MIACLPMYMRPEVRAVHQRYWQAIRTELLTRDMSCPVTLSDAVDLMALWLSPDLVFSQTCGLPYRLHLHNKVKLIGTPDYGVDGCEPGYYHSVFITRKSESRRRVDDYCDDVFACNSFDSQSGYAAPYAHCRKLGFWFKRMKLTNAHVSSAHAVMTRQASIAAIDAVTWRLLTDYEPEVSQLRVIDRTSPTPGLPYIAARMVNEYQTFDAIRTAIDKLSNQDRSLLYLNGIVSISKADYLAVPNPDR